MRKKKSGTLVLDIMIVVLILLIAGEFLFVKLYKEDKICRHEWVSGYCKKCMIICDHTWNNSVCKNCGFQCRHKYDTEGICSVCGSECEHSWKSGKCRLCKMECVHEWEKGICGICRRECLHEWIDGKCSICGMECEHEKFLNGICARCGVRCSHESHHPDTLICNFCGERVYHTYTANRCTGCGVQTPFQDTYMPEEILEDVTQTGTVVNVSYETVNYPYELGTGLKSSVITKCMMVYLPYGYDPNKQYDVLFLLHGANGNELSWLCGITDYRWYNIYATKILDGMIEHGYCKPLIVVAPTTYTKTTEAGELYNPDQFIPELANDILPYVVQHYATYALGTSEEDIMKARDHFGVAGFSDGALFTLRSAARYPNYFSWFGAYSGNNGTQDIVDKMNETGLDINFFFAGSGDMDLQHDRVEREYKYFLDSGKITDGVNSKCMTIVDGGHSWTTWDMCLYNSLLVLFNKTAE